MSPTIVTRASDSRKNLVESGEIVEAHIRGEQRASQLIAHLSDTISNGGELSNFLAFCAGRAGSPTGAAFLNGAARRLQKALERGL